VLIGGVVSGASTFVIGLIFSFYVLLQKERLARQGRQVLYALFPESWADKALEVLRLSGRTFSSFLSGQCVEAVILGALFVAAMTVFRMPYALLVGVLHWGVAGAAGATVLAQYAAGLGILAYCQKTCPHLRPSLRRLSGGSYRAIFGFSLLTCVQQSVMNFGILMIQGLVNSFGPTVMAAFAAAVKIDAFAYLPVQDFGGAFSTFIAQNHGAGEAQRIRRGLRGAVLTVALFSAVVSGLIFFLAPALMGLFVEAGEEAVIAAGVRYLRIEGAFYVGIGCLFLLYGLCRALGKPGMSVVLTVFSLGTRVALAYALAPRFGVEAIWWAIPIGWVLADTVGFVYYGLRRGELLLPRESKTDRSKR